VVSFLFSAIRPEGPGARYGHLEIFVDKTLILTGCNVAVNYAAAPEILGQISVMMEVPWNIEPTSSWPILCFLILVFVGFAFYDLVHSARMASDGPLPREVTAVNIYEDPKVPMSTCIQTFLLSGVFLGVYAGALLKPVQMTLFSRALWALSLFVQAYVTAVFRQEELEFGSWSTARLASLGRWAVRLDDQANQHGLWASLLSKAWLEEADSRAPKLSRAEVYTRFFMCYISNGLFRIFIVYSLPVYLATCGGMSDFALNAFAVTFISELDDLPSEASYTVVSSNAEESREVLRPEEPLLKSA